MTKSMKAAINETQRRRQIQWEHNQKHSITATTIYKPIRERMIAKVAEDATDYKVNMLVKGRGRGKPQPAVKPKGSIIDINKNEQIDLSKVNPEGLTPGDIKKLTAKLIRRMKQAANEMDFELAAEVRDTLKRLEE
jgi:excinuclease ABC subunit B